METVIYVLMQLGLSEFEAIALIKLLIAALCGGMIGLEREMKGRPAGLKTFSLVCIGSALAMVTNEYINMTMSGGTGDSARMAAQVISGIGFLGAGTIMVTGHNQVKGLTTAAALWVTAALGIAIGSGFYFGGVAGLFVIYLTSFVYRYIDTRLTKNSRMMKIYVEGINEAFMLRLVEYFTNGHIKVLSLTRRADNKWYKKDTCAIIELDFGKKSSHEVLLEDIRAMEGIRYVEEL